MARKRLNSHIGSDFEDYLREQGQLESATALAIKRVLAWQLSAAVKRDGAEGGRGASDGSSRPSS